MFEEIRNPDERVRAVSTYGSNVAIDPTVPAKRYFRSGKEMLRMANVYCDEKNYEAAFILYTKYITLFVERLPKHPDYKSAPKDQLVETNVKLKDVFPIAEIVKKKLKTRYTEQEIARRELEKKEAEARAKRQEEERIREEKRKQDEEKRRKEAEERENDMKLVYGEEMIKEQEEQFRLLAEQERKRQEAAKRATGKPPDDRAPPTTPAKVPPGEQTADELAALAISQQYPSVPPPSYGKVSSKQDGEVLPPTPQRSLKPSAPTVDRSTKPMDHFMSTGATTSNRFNLKTVWIPAELMVKFLNLAQSNTNKGVETGGFLFGKLARSEFRVTHLILPDQMGKSDSFTDLSDEDELFVLQDQYDVTQLGWIHTHPTQTAFLSSVDQHVQASFQRMLPESIAIVCSPKHNETGMFYLTPDYGLDYVVSCTGKGFHPHPSNPPLFDACSHAQIDPAGSITVVDLRKR